MCIFHRKKTPMPGSHFIYNLQRVILLKEDLRHMCFPMNFAKFLRTSFLKTTLGDCFWTKEYPCVTRSRHRRCSMKVVLKNCFKYTGRHLCKGVFFNKVAGLGLQLCYKRDSGTDVFKSTFFTEHLRGDCFCLMCPFSLQQPLMMYPRANTFEFFIWHELSTYFWSKIILTFTRSLLDMKTHEDERH